MKSRLPRERRASVWTIERDEEGENHGRERKPWEMKLRGGKK